MKPRQFEARDATRNCRHCSLTSAIGARPENICSCWALLVLTGSKSCSAAVSCR